MSDGPYYPARSADDTHWIVSCPRGAAAVAPPREGQVNQFDFMSFERAKVYADNFNREIADWLTGREQVRIYQALEDRAASWRHAADMYCETQPDLAKRMEGNAEAIELLMYLGTDSGIDKITAMIPGYEDLPLPELPE